MNVEYITHSGDDLLVVNAARVSFDKETKEFRDNDAKLIKYLATHNHFTPFTHPQITLRMKAPIAIRTQCFKHKIGFTENEVSRRYVDDTPEFFIPDVWRGRPTDGAKQGSSSEEVTHFTFTSLDRGQFYNDVPITPEVNYFYEVALLLYEDMVKGGVAPEQARFVLPQGMYTSWFWTGSLAAYARFYKQRIDPHAQKEIQDLAKLVGEIIQPLYPVSWSALTE